LINGGEKRAVAREREERGEKYKEREEGERWK